jgi:hypothetical protein
MDGLFHTGLSFAIEGEPFSCEPYGSGHIHQSFLLESGNPKDPNKYILQELNTDVFRKPESVQDNISRILGYLRKPDSENFGFQDLQMVLSCEGNKLHKDERGRFWRCFRFVENSRSLEKVENAQQAFEGGRSFGYFSVRLKDYDARRLHITIPKFMDMEWRQQQLTYTELTNPGPRLKESHTELKMIRDFSWIAEKYIRIRQALPDRVAHNDTKISNVLFDADSGKGKCVIDLDTVMTGTLLTEFGDMVRSYTSSGGEDETEPGRYTCREDLFEGLVEGYSEAVSAIITDVEKMNLLLGAKAVILMQAIRFMTDYLGGDRYYKTGYPGQNLRRTRNQLGLLSSLIEKEDLFLCILDRSF